MLYKKHGKLARGYAEKKMSLRVFPKRISHAIDVVLVLIFVSLVKGNDCPISVDTPGSTTCLRPDDYIQNPREIPFRDLGAGGVSVFASGAQVIVPSYTFQCYGTVTLWRTFMQPGGREDGKYDITFQVWRPSDTVQSTGCYSLVGENIFRNIDLGSGGLVCEAPPAGSEIRVQPGDIVGFHSTHERGGERGVQMDISVDTETVWYAVDAQPSSDPQCVYSVGNESGRTLQTYTNHAPIFSVTLDAEECPEVATPTTVSSPPNTPLSLTTAISSATTSTPSSSTSAAITTSSRPSNSASTGVSPTTSPPQHSPPRPTTTTTVSDRSTEPAKNAVNLATQPFKNSNHRGPPRKAKATTTPLISLNIGEITAIVIGSLALLVLLGTITTVCLVRYFRKWRREQVQKVIHTLVYESVDSSNVQHSKESTHACTEDVTYDVLESQPTYSNLTDSLKQPPTSDTHQYYYIQTNNCTPSKQSSVTYYRQPRSIDEYDQPIILCDSRKSSTQVPVAPYAIGNIGLRHTLNRDNLSNINDDTQDSNFNIVSNEAYKVTKQ